MHSPLHTPNPTQPCGLCGGAVAVALALGATTTGRAQTPPAASPAALTTVAQVQSLDRFEAEQERLKKLLADRPDAYIDKVMDPSELPPPSEDDASAHAEAPGGLSTWLYESRIGSTRQSASEQPTRRETELGLRTELRRETINHGEWVLQADVRHQSNNNVEGVVSYLGQAEDKRGERVSLRNLGFPITTRILADTTVGDLGSEITDGLARSYRLSLGTSNVRGLGFRAFSREFDLRAGTGARGQLLGGPYPGFERETGQLSWLGYTQRWGDKLYASAQIQRAADTAWRGSSTAFDVEEAVQSTSLAASLGWGYQLANNGDKRVRLTLLHNQDAAEQRSRSQSSRGAFLEGAWLLGRYQHEAGLYGTDPQLRFGDQWISDGSTGVYWRLDHLGIRTSWGVGLHHDQRDTDTVSNTRGQDRNTFSGNLQHRIDGRNSVGGNLYLSRVRYDTSASRTSGLQTSYATAYYQTRQRNWGDSRLRLTSRRNQTLVSDEPAATGEELEWEQDWIVQTSTQTRSQFQTTLGWARDRSAGEGFVYPTAGVRFRHWIDGDWNLGGSLRHTSRRGSLSTTRGLSGSFDTERRLGGGWHVGASVYLNQTVFDYTPSGSDPFDSNLSNRSNNTSAYVFLRYEGQSGQGFSSSPELNGEQRVGAGSISGQVFYDADRDGLQQLAEGGVTGVEVWLDQRYRTTTDAQGQFEFPVVSTGSHLLTLKLESVPLPWGASAGSRLVVEVPLRGRVMAPIPVVKTGE